MTRATPLMALAVLLVAAAPSISTVAADQPSAGLRGTAGSDLPGGVELVELVDLPPAGSVDVAPDQDLRSALVDAVDPRDATSLLDAVTQHVATAWDVTDVLRSDGATTVVPAPLSGGTFVDGKAALDTDGDGLDDVVLTATDVITGATDLVALRGLDGQEQWRTPLASWHDAIGWPAGDLTGDGIEDLFGLDLDWEEYTITSDETCDEDGCEGFVHETFAWQLSARSGADGSLLWQQTHPGEYRWDYVERETEDGSEYSWTLEAEDLVSLPYPGADHDGDGGRDVLVNTIDLTDSFTETSQTTTLGSSRSGSQELDSATTARVVRGADGSDLMAALTSSGPSIAWLRGVGDATGDGTADLLWQRTRYDNDTWSCERYVIIEHCDDEQDAAAPQVAIDLLDGADLTTAWSFTAPVHTWSSYVVPLFEDLDGAPGTDLLLRVAAEDDLLNPSDPFEEDPWADDLVLLSGADGSVAWRIDSPQYGAPSAVAEMGGTAGPDVLLSGSVLSWYSSCSAPDDCESQTTATQVALRFDGTTGEALTDTSRTYDLGEDTDYMWFSFSPYVGDHDGDGVLDPRMALGTDARSVAVVQSAVTGDLLFEQVGEEQLLLTFGGGDLDGTGTDELGTYWWNDGRYEILRMPGGELLHDLTDVEGWLYAGGDQDGVRGDEVVRVLHTLGEDGHVEAIVESLNGATLSPRWSRPVTAG